MVDRRTLGVGLVVVALALPATALAFTLQSGGAAHPPEAMPTSSPSPGVSEIGALYANARTTHHGCTASVVDSPRGNTLITAAHCVSGSGAGMVFVPGQHGATAPYGRWTVTAVHVGPRWVARQDPDDDVAFFTVAPRTIHGVRTEIEQVTGAYRLGRTARPGQRITVTGYPAGGTNDAITCTTTVYLAKKKYPAFDCRGYVDGTSGSPWLETGSHRTPTIVGVIGGLNQGGCVDSTSYSPPLSHHAHRTYRSASHGASADVAPLPGGDGCTRR